MVPDSVFRKVAEERGVIAKAEQRVARHVYPSRWSRVTTASQLELSAHAPCTSTMLSLDPLAEPVLATAAAGVTVRVDAAWLTSLTSAAVARATADRIIRGLPVQPDDLHLSGSLRGELHGAGSCPLRLCAASAGLGVPAT